MAGKKDLSLLPEAENPNSFISRLFYWLTTVGRWVIVLTELIVVSAFISRFWLDRKNSDLSEVLRQQETILESTQDFEKEFVTFQQKLKTIKEFYADQPDYVTKITSLVNGTPSDIVYNNLSIKKDEESGDISANASLIAYREESIINFISNLMLNPAIKNVDINQIEKKDKENSYSISISVIFKPSKS